MLQFRVAAESNVGLVRTNNEDSAFAGPSLALVADGVGGAAAGEVASTTAAVVARSLAANPDHDDPLTLLGRVVFATAEQLRAGVASDPNRAGMGTTLTAVYTDGERVALAHVGDSRGYRLRDGVLDQVTTDHTLVQAMVEAGRMTPEQARSSAHRHIVTRALGATAEPEPDVDWLDVVAGDRVLLCSDGLSDLVDDDTIARLLVGAEPEEVVHALVGAALARGGRDNVTCLVADVVDDPTPAVTATTGHDGEHQGDEAGPDDGPDDGLIGALIGAAAG